MFLWLLRHLKKNNALSLEGGGLTGLGGGLAEFFQKINSQNLGKKNKATPRKNHFWHFSFIGENGVFDSFFFHFSTLLDAQTASGPPFENGIFKQPCKNLNNLFNNPWQDVPKIGPSEGVFRIFRCFVPDTLLPPLGGDRLDLGPIWPNFDRTAEP